MFAESAFYGNIWIAQFDMPKIGATISQHEHEHDHVSLLTSGKVSVQIGDGPETIYAAPSIILIRKNLEHKVVSLSENTLWYCIFALRDIDGNVLDQFDEKNLPKMDPTFYGNQSVAIYKSKYEDAIRQLDSLRLQCIKAENERDYYINKAREYVYNNSFILPLNEDGSPSNNIKRKD